jgi:hypothetical protein
MKMDLTDKDGKQLVDAYNKLAEEAGIKHVAKFENLEIGRRRVAELQSAIAAFNHPDNTIPKFLRRYPDPENPPVVDAPLRMRSFAEEENRPKRSDEEIVIDTEADRRWRCWTPCPGMMTRPQRYVFRRQVKEEIARRKSQDAARSAEAVAEEATTLASASRVKRADCVIRVLCANPRRPGTDSHRFFEAMVGGPTVGEYVAKFKGDDQKKAARWLANTVNDGFAKILGAS